MTKFKVGDWVRYYNKKEPFQITKIHNDTKGMFAKWKYVSDQCAYTEEMLEHWQPKEGEWVWYGFELVEVIDVQEDHIKICRQKSDSYEEVSFDNLKPFVGELPAITKES